MEFASRAVGSAGLATGIVGATLGAINSGVFGNGGIFRNNNGYPENQPVSRYEAEQAARIAELETEVKLRDANTFTMGEMGKLRDYVDSKFARVESEICDQKVYNATLNGAVSCIQGQIAQLAALTKLVIPNTSVCPGWGNVTVTPATAATA